MEATKMVGCGGAVWGKGFFSLAFVTFGTGEGLLVYGIDARC